MASGLTLNPYLKLFLIFDTTKLELKSTFSKIIHIRSRTTFYGSKHFDDNNFVIQKISIENCSSICVTKYSHSAYFLQPRSTKAAAKTNKVSI